MTEPVLEPGTTRRGISHNRDFRFFWASQSVSFVGDYVTVVALPLTAVSVLGATAAEMGILTALHYLPFAFFGLLAGVWVDRVRRRHLLIWSDVLGAAVLATIPVAAVLGWLRIEQLYVVTFVVGSFWVVSAVAYQALIPSLVERAELVTANSRLEASNSAAAIAGPPLAGFLVQLLTAPVAIAVDVVSFIVSAVLLSRIRAPEPPPLPADAPASVRSQVAEGLGLVLRHRLLRPIMSCGATHNFFRRMLEALLVLYMARELSLDPVLIGVVFAAAGPGALVGALLARPIQSRIGVGWTLTGTQLLTGVACLCVPLAGGPLWAVLAILMVGEFLLGTARPIFNITQLSLRQGITPERLQGRVNATMRFLMWSVTPVAAVTGGLLGSAIGLRPTLLLAGLGVLIAAAWVALSPVGGLRDMPEMEPSPS